MLPFDPISIVVDVLISAAPTLADASLRNETIVKALDAVGLKPQAPPSTFEHCYIFALVDFAQDGTKPTAVLEFLRIPEVRDAFQHAFTELDFIAILDVIKWHRVGDDVKASGTDIKAEVDAFSKVFEGYALRTSSPGEMLILRSLSLLQRSPLHDALSAQDKASGSKYVSPEERIFDAQIDEARNLLKAGNPNAARTLLEGVAKAIDGGSVSDNMRFRLETNFGACALELIENDRAANHFERAFQYAPTDPKAVANVALAKFLRGDYAAAAKLAQQAMQADTEAKTSASAIYLESVARLQAYQDVEELIDERYLENLDYLRVAGVIFLWIKNYAKAEEMLRRALLREPDDVGSLMLLAQVLFFQRRERLMKQVFVSEQEAEVFVPELEEPVSLVNHAIALTEKRDNRKQLHDALAGRAGLLAAKGDFSHAAQDSDRVLAEEPTHPMALYNRGLVALQLNDYATAIRCLSALPETDREDLEYFVPLAHAFLEQGQPDQALETLSRLPPDSTNRPRIEAFIIRCHALMKLGDNAAVEAEKLQFLQGRENDPVRLEAVAQVEYLQRNQDAALAHLIQAHTYAQEEHYSHLALRLATEYVRRRQYSQAIPYFEELKDQLDRDPLLARDYLTALYNARHYSKAQKLARSLRANGSSDAYVLQILAEISEWTGDLRSASELYSELAKIQPNKAHFMLAQARAEFRQANFDQARTILLELKSLLPDEPRDVIQVAQMLAILGEHEDVIEMAYRARRMAMNDPQIHLVYTQIFFAVERASPSRFDVKGIDTDTAVLVNEQNGEKRWLKIYSSIEPDRGRNEFSTNDATAQSLMGHRTGETVEIEAGLYEPLVYAIEQVQSIYVRAFQETLENFGAWFPEDKSLSKLHVPENDPTKFLRIIAGQSSDAGEFYNQYARGEFTFSQFAQATGRNEFELWRGLIGKPEHRLLASTGSHQEQNHYLAVARQAHTVTLDMTALLTARYLDVLELLPSNFDKLFIPQSIIERTNRHLTDLRLMENTEYGIAGFENGRFYFYKVSREVIRAQIEWTEAFLDFLKANCTVVPLDAVILEWVGEDEAVHLPDQASVTTLLVARQTNSVLYSDDLKLRDIAAHAMGVPGFWTQSLLKRWVEIGVISEEQYFDKTVQLVCGHYHFTSINPPLLNYLVHKNNMHITPEVGEVFKTLEGPNTTEDDAVRIVGECLRETWFSPAFVEQRVFILDQCLNSVTKRRVVPIVLQKLDQYLEIRLNLAPVALNQIRGEMNNWYRAHQLNSRNDPRL